jgi:TnpA family transposase
MPRRVTLTDRQRDALFRLPIEQGELLMHYTLSDEDLGHIRQRRRPRNRFGFALQLCVLRYPGRVLAPGEVMPAPVSTSL